MNWPTLYERFEDSRLDAPLKPMVIRSRTNGRWWVWGARMRLLSTIHPTFAEAIAYATAQPAQIDAEPGQGRENGAGVGDDSQSCDSTAQEGM